MNQLNGKKALCFLALPHHNRFLVPIMDALREHGMETAYFTTAAEAAFEITLNQAHLPYRHALDYGDREIAEKVTMAYGKLREVFHDKILANDILQSAPIIIHDKTIRSAVESFYCLDRMIAVEKPDVLFALHELNPWGKILGYLSHVHRVPYFTLQEGLYYADNHYYRFHTDFTTACLVWGDECRRTLLRAGCADDKILPIGNTQIFGAKDHFTAPEIIRQTRRALGVADGKKILLLLLSYSRYEPFDLRQMVDWMRRRGDIVAVLKWHPITPNEFIARALDRHRGEPLLINALDHDTYALLGASDVCATVGNSTTGLEALAYGKPLIEVRLPDQAYSFALQGVAEPAGDFTEIAAKAEAILSGGVAPSIATQVERYLADNFAYRDAGVTERIVAIVGESLAARISQEARPAPIALRRDATYPCSIVLAVEDGPLAALLATLESIAANTAGDIFEVIIVNCAANSAIRELLEGLDGDLTIVPGDPGWSFAQACNRAAEFASGEYLAFLKPGYLMASGWLEALIKAAVVNPQVGVVGGCQLDEHGLIWHLGTAFDVNQSPFSMYRMLPAEFAGARRTRQFRAVEAPFLTRRELFGRLGGFGEEFHNRFEDIDFCLKAGKEGALIQYTPGCTTIRHSPGWLALDDRGALNRIRFYSKWTGYLWQDDEVYLGEDKLTHDQLSELYRDLAGRVVAGAGEAVASLAPTAA